MRSRSLSYFASMRELGLPMDTELAVAMKEWKRQTVAAQGNHERLVVLSQVKQCLKARSYRHCQWDGCGVTLDRKTTGIYCQMHGRFMRNNKGKIDSMSVVNVGVIQSGVNVWPKGKVGARSELTQHMANLKLNGKPGDCIQVWARSNADIGTRVRSLGMDAIVRQAFPVVTNPKNPKQKLFAVWLAPEEDENY